MGDLVELRPSIPAMSEEGIDKVRQLETAVLAMPQVPIRIDHVLHAGMYARTAYVPKDALITGVLIKVPTLLILDGAALLYVDDDEPLHLSGYHVLAAAAGRKQAFVAVTDVALTMIFPTAAKTVEEAEAEFTDEPHLLQSRRL